MRGWTQTQECLTVRVLQYVGVILRPSAGDPDLSLYLQVPHETASCATYPHKSIGAALNPLNWQGHLMPDQFPPEKAE